MGKIHITALLIFVRHASLSMEIDVCVDQDLCWTEVKGMEPYELLSDVLFIFIEFLLNACTTIIKLFIILACIITKCTHLFIEILVICVTIQFRCIANASTRVARLVYTCQSNFDYDVTNDFRSLLQQRIQQPMQAFLTLVILFFLLMYVCLDHFLFSFY